MTTPARGLAAGLTLLAFALPLSIAGLNMAAALVTFFALLLPATGRPSTGAGRSCPPPPP